MIACRNPEFGRYFAPGLEHANEGGLQCLCFWTDWGFVIDAGQTEAEEFEKI